MKVERVEPIPIMKVYDVKTYKCVVPSDAESNDDNTYDIEEETEVDEPGSPIEIKDKTQAEINNALKNAEIE